MRKRGKRKKTNEKVTGGRKSTEGEPKKKTNRRRGRGNGTPVDVSISNST